MMTGCVLTLVYCVDLPDIRTREYVKFKTLPLFFGTSLFAFEGICLVLPLQNSMKNPKDFNKPLGVMNVGMFFVSIIYLVLGLMGYWKFGEATEGGIGTLTCMKNY
jgi:proton-coupled amino acid transporter